MFKRDGIRLGIAPTGWTNDDMPRLGAEISFEQTVSEMALAGFEGCGIGNKYPKDPDRLLAALELRNLRVSGVWFGTQFAANEMHDRTIEDFKQTVAFLRRLGSSRVIVAELAHAVHQQPVAVLPNKPHFSDDQWWAMVTGLEAIGRLAREAGLEISYHPHVGTGVETLAEIDRLMNDADPDLVPLLHDAGHLVYAGVDPVHVADGYGDRINHIHLKDVREAVLKDSVRRGRSFLESILNGVFTVPGSGDIDFRPIFEAFARHKYFGWMIVEAEQDPAVAIPLEQALKARSYLRDMIGF